MSKLPYLVGEINAALEVYLSGRIGQQYNRTAFILCDDCAELASKLFLVRDNRRWSDTKANGQFKRFVEVTGEVRGVFQAKWAGDLPAVDVLLKRIEGRRDRRNAFFHTTQLLDLNFHSRDCVEAFCDLVDYCKLLFPADWELTVAATGNMDTCEAVVRLDKKGYGDPSIFSKVNAILSTWPRNGPTPKPRGCEIGSFPEDLHLRLAIRNGGKTLRDRLQALL
jgi:hypothetical protein